MALPQFLISQSLSFTRLIRDTHRRLFSLSRLIFGPIRGGLGVARVRFDAPFNILPTAIWQTCCFRSVLSVFCLPPTFYRQPSSKSPAFIPTARASHLHFERHLSLILSTFELPCFACCSSLALSPPASSSSWPPGSRILFNRYRDARHGTTITPARNPTLSVRREPFHFGPFLHKAFSLLQPFFNSNLTF